MGSTFAARLAGITPRKRVPHVRIFGRGSLRRHGVCAAVHHDSISTMRLDVKLKRNCRTSKKMPKKQTSMSKQSASGSVSGQSDETPYEAFASVCRILAIGLFALTFVFENFVIPSSSMASTLLGGDHVLVNRAAFAPRTSWAPFVPYRDVHRGDIIVFYKPLVESNGDRLFLVKRVIGIPGDHIHLRNGIVYLNGVAQNEPYAAKPPYASYDRYRDEFPSVPPSTVLGVSPEWCAALPSHIQGEDLVVPPGRYFAMGDNRSHSLDSRYWGFVPRANIVGRPLFVYWSFATPEDQIYKTELSERASFALHEAVHFFDQTRWQRTLHVVR
jgi:signal peptidase I